MAGTDVGEPKASRGGKRHKKKRRLSVRIDMTPMVDVAFLLLTFFMLTTVFSKPQTMEINLPPDVEAKVEVAESNLLTLRIDSTGTIYYNLGVEDPQRIAFDKLRPLLMERNKANPKLVTLIKVDREGKYSMMVNVMDELNLANITRFTLAPFGADDKKALAKTQG